MCIRNVGLILKITFVLCTKVPTFVLCTKVPSKGIKHTCTIPSYEGTYIVVVCTRSPLRKYFRTKVLSYEG